MEDFFLITGVTLLLTSYARTLMNRDAGRDTKMSIAAMCVGLIFMATALVLSNI